MNENLLIRIHRQLVCCLKKLQSPLLLLIRLYWGWGFFETGKGKLLHLASTANYFNELGIPWPKFNAEMAGTTECVGGLFLLLGLFSRLASIPLTCTMIVAYLTAHLDTLKTIFQSPESFTSAQAFPFLLACLIILAFGPGKFSVDWLVDKYYLKKKED